MTRGELVETNLVSIIDWLDIAGTSHPRTFFTPNCTQCVIQIMYTYEHTMKAQCSTASEVPPTARSSSNDGHAKRRSCSLIGLVRQCRRIWS